ncbi:MAG: helix-turn-helix domain-containing protein [Puniceicoccales bacterium]|jgi:transcriptional regulator with XRE-family HTH domain|nr:helix-turn-helix domain-containing protein [Puniceicoccales bacterium]
MQQTTIGERLQQARQRLGLSLEDVAATLKIRKDVLLKFESNEFDIKLPPVYRKGFFKAYVKLLKLNAPTLLADYEEIVGEINPSTSFSLGQLKLDNPKSIGNDNKPEITELEPGENSARYVRPVPQFVHFRLLIIGIVITLIVLTCGLYLRYTKEHAASTHPAVQDILPIQDTVASESTLVLTALDTVQIFVRQESDRRRLFAGTLNKNEHHTLTKSGPVQISYSEGKFLLIEQANGLHIKPQKEGRGWIRVP